MRCGVKCLYNTREALGEGSSPQPVYFGAGVSPCSCCLIYLITTTTTVATMPTPNTTLCFLRALSLIGSCEA